MLHKLIFSIMFLVLIITVQTNAQEKNENHKHHQTEMRKDSLVRMGEINVDAIDKNKDGIVYQDPMDWNVISDKPGRCPLCEMKLKKVTIKQAKDNLIKHGHKVKGHMHDMDMMHGKKNERTKGNINY